MNGFGEDIVANKTRRILISYLGAFSKVSRLSSYNAVRQTLLMFAQEEGRKCKSISINYNEKRKKKEKKPGKKALFLFFDFVVKRKKALNY